MRKFKNIRISYDLWELLTTTSKHLGDQLNRKVTFNECIKYLISRGTDNVDNQHF